MELYHLDIAFPVPLACTVVRLGSFLLVHNCKPKPIDKNIAHWKKILLRLKIERYKSHILKGVVDFTYILKSVFGMSGSHEATTHLVCVGPDNGSVMPNYPGCTSLFLI